MGDLVVMPSADRTDVQAERTRWVIFATTVSPFSLEKYRHDDDDVLQEKATTAMSL